MARAVVVGPEAPPVLPGPPPPRVAARQDRARRSLRTRVVAASLVGVLALAGLVWVLVRGGGADDDGAGSAGARTQSTVVFQVVGARKTALSSALLAHDTAGAGSGAAVLVPSQLVVDVPGFGSTTFGETSRLGNPAAPALAVSQAMGVIVDGSWTLSTTGLARLVDELGGLSVDVDREVLRPTAGGGSTVLVPAGPQQLDGVSAAAYATYLAPGEPEQKRLARFADVLQALLAELPDDPAEVAALLTGLGRDSTATVPPEGLGSFLAGLGSDQRADRMSVQNLPVRPLDTGGGAQAFVVDAVPTRALVDSQLAGSLPPARPGGPVRVLVQNGVGTPGLGESARNALVDAGFTYVNGGNANRFGYRTSVVLIRDAGAAARKEGAEVATVLGLPASDLRVAAQGQSVADVVVILGADYKP